MYTKKKKHLCGILTIISIIFLEDACAWTTHSQQTDDVNPKFTKSNSSFGKVHRTYCLDNTAISWCYTCFWKDCSQGTESTVYHPSFAC